MVSELVLLRHAEPHVEIADVPSKWGVSKEGKAQAIKLAFSGVFNDIDLIISSDEPKAYQTADMIALRQKQSVIRNPLFDELNRDGGFYLSSSQYKLAVQTILQDYSFRVDGWETAASALSRFKRGIDQVLAEHSSKRVLIISHGIVLTMYFSELLGNSDNMLVQELNLIRWDTLEYCSWGVVKDNKVVKDII
ncbi:MAG: histidine phosphatase family protein [Candidatus Thorarchaeota archaeon]